MDGRSMFQELSVVLITCLMGLQAGDSEALHAAPALLWTGWYGHTIDKWLPGSVCRQQWSLLLWTHGRCLQSAAQQHPTSARGRCWAFVWGQPSTFHKLPGCLPLGWASAAPPPARIQRGMGKYRLTQTHKTFHQWLPERWCQSLRMP